MQLAYLYLPNPDHTHVPSPQPQTTVQNSTQPTTEEPTLFFPYHCHQLPSVKSPPLPKNKLSEDDVWLFLRRLDDYTHGRSPLLPPTNLCLPNKRLGLPTLPLVRFPSTNLTNLLHHPKKPSYLPLEVWEAELEELSYLPPNTPADCPLTQHLQAYFHTPPSHQFTNETLEDFCRSKHLNQTEVINTLALLQTTGVQYFYGEAPWHCAPLQTRPLARYRDLHLDTTNPLQARHWAREKYGIEIFDVRYEHIPDTPFDLELFMQLHNLISIWEYY